MDAMSPASAWALARRKPNEYRRKADAATRCYGVCPPQLTWSESLVTLCPLGLRGSSDSFSDHFWVELYEILGSVIYTPLLSTQSPQSFMKMAPDSVQEINCVIVMSVFTPCSTTPILLL